MGTRSLTVILDEEGNEICVLYRQYDGYPTGHGAELKEFLAGFTVVNGFASTDPPKSSNGMGCLAAQTIGHFKSGIGGFYLYAAHTRDCGEEYIYTIYLEKTGKFRSRLHLKIQAAALTMFGLPGTKQNNMPVIYDGPADDFNPEGVEQQWRERTEDPVNDVLDDQILSTEIIIPE